MTTDGFTDNQVWIDAPMERVWTVTNDVAGWPELFSEYTSVEVLEQGVDYVRFRITMHPDEQGRTWSWVSERYLDPAERTVTARRVETGPFEYMNLRWEYRPVNEGVELRWIQQFRMKPTAPVDTAGMAARINHRSPLELARIKQILETGAVS